MLTGTVRCKSCGGTYSTALPDGSVYYHACPDVVEHAVIDGGTGKTVKEEVRKPRVDARNENTLPDLVYLEGKPMKLAPHPEERAKSVLAETQAGMIAEGLGVEAVV